MAPEEPAALAVLGAPEVPYLEATLLVVGVVVEVEGAQERALLSPEMTHDSAAD